MARRDYTDTMEDAHKAFRDACGDSHGMTPSYNPGGSRPRGGNFIQAAIKRPGQLHRDLGVPQGQKIPTGKIAAAAKRGGKVGQRARFAQTLATLRK